MRGPLDALFSSYPLDCRPSSPPRPLGNSGGGSGASLWRFESPRGELVARAWPDGGRSFAEIVSIHDWLAAAAPLGFVAAPLPDLRGRTVQAFRGRYWEIAPWMSGEADLSPSPSIVRVEAAFKGLAQFHETLARSSRLGPSPGIQARLGELEDLVTGRGFAGFDDALNASPNDSRLDLARRWRLMAESAAPRLIDEVRRAACRIVSLQPCLRDARPEHFLFVDDRLTGLVDYGAMDRENVAADLSRLCSEWFDVDRAPRSAAFAAYTAVRPLEDGEWALMNVFDRTSAVLGAARWIRWHFLEHRVFADPTAVARGLSRAVDRLARIAVGL
jgi:Ser/Thr protein kinase RdoA (MazF antagonist)